MAGRGAVDTVCLVVPCFNEEHRLRPAQLSALVSDPRVSLVLVDDGSADRTLELLRVVGSTCPRITVVSLDRNRGKG